MTADIPLLERLARRAFVHTTHMIHTANNRPDVEEGDPKVGGHPAACASCIHILAALHLWVRRPQDFVACKPHASPADHSLHYLMGLFRDKDGKWLPDDEAAAVMGRLRKFSEHGELTFQSYHAEADPDSFHFFPSGSVGIPPVVSVYTALAYEYARDHKFEVPKEVHFWSLIGDSEFREGSLMEAMPDVAERELGNVTWIVDYNRQNLDGTRIPNRRGLAGTDADRIERTAKANGWDVIQVRHGRFREEVFARKGGAALQKLIEEQFSDYQLQMMLLARNAAAFRAEVAARDKAAAKVLESLPDADTVRLLLDLGGHDMARMIEALEASRRDSHKPCLIVAHTLKGWGLRCAAAHGNHSALPEDDEVAELLKSEGLPEDTPYARYASGSPEGRFLARRGEEFRKGMAAIEELKAHNLERVQQAMAKAEGLPDTIDINLKQVPVAHTQWMWGQLAAKLVRIGVDDELRAAGQKPAKELTASERRWGAIADLVLTMSPDVGTSTNINPAMDAKVYGPKNERNREEELGVRDRRRPDVVPHEEAWTRHIRFEIAEANCMSAAGAFGKMKDLAGVPFFPMMTVYDFFIKRALDQLFYNLYWRSGFVVVGTPSGVTLSPEGAQHSWKSDIQIPSLITWEPFFALEMDWILADAIRRHFTRQDEDRQGVLIRGVTRAVPQKALLERVRRHRRFKRDLPEGALLATEADARAVVESEAPGIGDEQILEATRQDCLAGGYYLVDWRGYLGYQPGENVVRIFSQGSPTTEALRAADLLLEKGIYADVIVVTSADLLCGRLGRADEFKHLRQGLGIDGSLWLSPAGGAEAPLQSVDMIDLSGRRVPVVSVNDGEEGILDNLGSVLGVRQEALAVRKFSKCGRPSEVFAYQHLDVDSVVEAAGKVLAETALERTRVTPSALRYLGKVEQSPGTVQDWQQLWS
jgi:pyruvate dehydrogenase E1 component